MSTAIDMMTRMSPEPDAAPRPAGEHAPPPPSAPLTTPLLRPARSEDEPAVRQLLTDSGLQPHFHVDQFVVATEGDTIVGCGRLRPLVDGSFEIASVAIAPHQRGTGLGGRVVSATLERATSRVYGLSLVPAFLEKFGFAPLEAVPASLRDRAEGACSCYQYVPMAREKAETGG